MPCIGPSWSSAGSSRSPNSADNRSLLPHRRGRSSIFRSGEAGHGDPPVFTPARRPPFDAADFLFYRPQTEDQVQTSHGNGHPEQLYPYTPHLSSLRLRSASSKAPSSLYTNSVHALIIKTKSVIWHGSTTPSETPRSLRPKQSPSHKSTSFSKTPAISHGNLKKILSMKSATLALRPPSHPPGVC